jgi:(1->4)-alpha-D-glucan 1-alpha-D-glucosylmutase
LNEVGGDPGKFGITVEEFHRANAFRLDTWPHAMLSTSTHDSKRSEDVRARINVISEIPAAWRMSLRRWRDWNRSRKRLIDGLPAPFRNDEYLLYQTLLGAWPVEGLDDEAWQNFVERIGNYMLKALREAKEHTSWANPNEEYEKAVSDFVRAILTRGKKNRFLPDFGEFQRRISRIGMFNSLSQVLLKLTCPGAPDIYQGNELWDFSLVDPDNRRPVDYERRERMLKDLKNTAGAAECACQATELLRNLDDARIKLYTITRALSVRKQNPGLFAQGEYLPLKVSGPRAEHICAFGRRKDQAIALTVVPCLSATLLGDKFESPVGEEVWGDTRIEIPAGLPVARLRNSFTGETLDLDPAAGLRISKVLATFPIGLLLGEQG